MDPKIQLIKGSVDASTADAEHKIDGLSGATLTGNGVTNLVQFWMGENGYAPFLNNLRAGEA
jgi:Na+-transporting NADH:ubiquinone oxidoreductase subunit C